VVGFEHPGPALQARSAQHAGEQGLHRREAHSAAALEQREADGDAEVRLTQTRRADQDERVSLGDEALVEVAQEDLPIELRPEAEAKSSRVFSKGKPASLSRRRSWFS
jgi:hypothetical protein